MSGTRPPIRVGLDAHVVGRRKTGNETYVLGLAVGLAARSDVEVTAYLPRGVAWPLDGASVRIRRLWSPRPELRIALELPVRARRDRVDLLHVQYVAPPLAGLPVVTAVHDVSFEDQPDLFPRPMLWRLRSTVRHAVRRSAVVVTPSEFSRQRLIHHYRLDPARVLVTPPSATVTAAAGPAEAGRLVAQLGVAEPFVLVVGDLHPRKNVPRVIEAVARARAGGTQLGVVLAGQRAWGAAEVDAAVQRHDAGAWVHRVGYVDGPSLGALYAEARVVAYLSLYEGFGLPMIEAMASGTPVVAADRTAIPEVAADAALLVDPLDNDAICDALVRAATDTQVRARLRSAGLARAARFTPAATAEATMVAYRRAVGR
jgi:glycosyltransferase involved in cell wall biosynthesis